MNEPGQSTPQVAAAAVDSARLLMQARTAALGTLDAASGHPYVSFVTLALDQDGTPLLLISRLARHTQNLAADARATVMCSAVDHAVGDPLAGFRVTLIGHIAPTVSLTARARLLERHPDASVYADFADFRFVEMAIDHAHFIGGFGRIIDIDGADLTAALRACV